LSPRIHGTEHTFGTKWLGWKGYPVWIPFGHSPNVDLVAEIDERLVRIQVKTSTVRYKRGYAVTLCTRGGKPELERFGQEVLGGAMRQAVRPRR
jgi:hypothetical protein